MPVGRWPQTEFARPFFATFFRRMAERVDRIEDAEIKDLEAKTINALVDHLSYMLPVLFPAAGACGGVGAAWWGEAKGRACRARPVSAARA